MREQDGSGADRVAGMPVRPARDRRVTLWEAEGTPYPGATYGTALARALTSAGCDVTTVRLAERLPLRHELEASAHVLTGGSTPVTSDAAWLGGARAALTRVLHRALDGHAQVVGICFGSQLIARTLGGPGAVRNCPNGIEAGLAHVRTTTDAPSAPGATRRPRKRTVAEFHYQEVVPEVLDRIGGTVQLTNDHSPVQGFSVGGHILGYQFHPELSPVELAATLSSHRLLLRTLDRPPSRAIGSIRDRKHLVRADTFDDLVLAPILAALDAATPAVDLLAHSYEAGTGDHDDAGQTLAA